MSFCLVGHLTKDILVLPNAKQPRKMVGGAVYYAAIALHTLGAKVEVVTKLAKDDQDLLFDLKQLATQVHCYPSTETTTFLNEYTDPKLAYRIQTVPFLAEPFQIEEIASISTKIVYIGTLTKDELSLACLMALRQNNKYIALDAQGLVRQIETTDNKIKPYCSKNVQKMLEYVDFLKLSDSESIILTNERDPFLAAKILSQSNEVIITMGERGSLIYNQGHFFEIPAFPPDKMTDTTGCGDTYFAAYLYARMQGENIKKSGLFAAAAASVKLSVFGGLTEKIHLSDY